VKIGDYIMRLPKTFVPQKNLDRKIESLIEKPNLRYKYNPGVVEELLVLGEEFLRTCTDEDVYKKKVYEKGVNLAGRISYSSKDVEELGNRIKPGTTKILGVYISALVNKVIKEKETIVLDLKAELDGIGINFKRGKLVVKGDTNDYTAYHMAGGKMIVKGDTNDHTADYMESGNFMVEGSVNDCTGCFMGGGKLTIGGNANKYTCYQLDGGKVIVKGKIKDLSPYFRKGVIKEGNRIVKKG